MQLLMPQLQNGHKEVLAFVLLAAKSNTDKNSKDFTKRRQASLEWHKFSMILGAEYLDLFLERCQRHITTVDHFVRNVNLIDLKFK